MGCRRVAARSRSPQRHQDTERNYHRGTETRSNANHLLRAFVSPWFPLLRFSVPSCLCGGAVRGLRGHARHRGTKTQKGITTEAPRHGATLIIFSVPLCLLCGSNFLILRAPVAALLEETSAACAIILSSWFRPGPALGRGRQ